MTSEWIFWVYTVVIYGIGLLIGFAWGRDVLNRIKKGDRR